MRVKKKIPIVQKKKKKKKLSATAETLENSLFKNLSMITMALRGDVSRLMTEITPT